MVAQSFQVGYPTAQNIKKAAGMSFHRDAAALADSNTGFAEAHRRTLERGSCGGPTKIYSNLEGQRSSSSGSTDGGNSYLLRARRLQQQQDRLWYDPLAAHESCSIREFA